MVNLASLHLTLSPPTTEGTEQQEKFSDAMIGRIRVPSAVEVAAQSIRNAIITGKLRPGMRLVERNLASALGIGQPTLREAFKELEYQGFVSKTPQRGTHVSKLTLDDVRRILEVRIVLEAFAVERAAVNMTPSAELKLRDLLGQMSAAANTNEVAPFHDADVKFHREIWALADNEYLAASLEGIALRLFVFGTLSHGCSKFLTALEQHRGIFEGLCSRDPEKARAAFVSQTVHFWNEAALIGVGPRPPGNGSTQTDSNDPNSGARL